MGGTFAPVNSVAVLLEASRGATHSASTPVVLADAGVENVNAQVDALIAAGVLHRLLAFTELKVSNSMIEAWWRSLKHQWLFLHPLDSVATQNVRAQSSVIDHAWHAQQRLHRRYRRLRARQIQATHRDRHRAGTLRLCLGRADPPI